MVVKFVMFPGVDKTEVCFQGRAQVEKEFAISRLSACISTSEVPAQCSGPLTEDMDKLEVRNHFLITHCTTIPHSTNRHDQFPYLSTSAMIPW